MMQVKSELKLLFTGLVTQYVGAGRVFDSMWKEIDEAYNAPYRHYHNMNHLRYISKRLEECPQRSENMEAMTFCLFYHDLVYEVPGPDNKIKSAEIAVQRMMALGVPPGSIELCKKHILATREHRKSTHPDSDLFCDADLAILGDTPEKYRQYATHIREEYKKVSDADFTEGRKKVMQKLLSLPRIFKTTYFNEKYEAQARTNISEEIRRLSKLR